MKLQLALLIILGLALAHAKPRFSKGVTVDDQEYGLGKVFQETEGELEESSVEVKHVLVLQANLEQTGSPQEVEYTDPCNIKQGYLTQITAIDAAQKLKNNDSHLTVLLHGRPVFAVLNKQILSLFENENVNSLIKSVNIKQIQAPVIVDSFRPQQCFQLVFADAHEILGTPVHSEEADLSALLTLCASSSKANEEWASAISEFHNCRQEVTEKFQQLSLKEQLEVRKQQIAEEENKEQAELIKEQQTNNEVAHKFSEENERENQQFQETVADLKEIIEKSQQYALKERAEAEEKQKKLQEETDQLQREKVALEKLLMAKAAEEEVQTELLIKAEQAESQKNIFEQTKEIFRKAKEDENKKVQRTQEQMLEEEERRQKELKQEMVNEAIQAELDLPADDCYSQQLIDDFPEASKETCYQIAQKSGEFQSTDVEVLNSCLNRNTFCETCCNYHIGIVHRTKRANCQNECASKLAHAEEDLGIKVTTDAVEVRIPRANELNDENTSPSVQLRFKEKQTKAQKVKAMTLRFKQAPQTQADKEFNAKQLKNWRENLTSAKKEKELKQKALAKKQERLQKSVKTAEEVLEHTAQLEHIVKQSHLIAQQKANEKQHTLELAAKIAKHAQDARARFLRR